MKNKESEIRKEILAKISIIKNGVNTASHKVSKEKLNKAEDWLKEIYEQVKKLEKLVEDNIS